VKHRASDCCRNSFKSWCLLLGHASFTMSSFLKTRLTYLLDDTFSKRKQLLSGMRQRTALRCSICLFSMVSLCRLLVQRRVVECFVNDELERRSFENHDDPQNARSRRRKEEGQELSLLHIVRTGSGARPAFYPMGTGSLSPEVERPGREADYSPPFSAEAKQTSALQCVFMGQLYPFLVWICYRILLILYGLILELKNSWGADGSFQDVKSVSKWSPACP
jgi:hypothetical protein